MIRRGYIFVEALVVVAVLVALMVMLAADQRASLQGIQNRLNQRRAVQAADAAVARALGALQSVNPDQVTLNDDWALLGDAGSDEYTLGDATYRVQITDAASQINVNTATQAQLQQLPLEPEQIDSLLDWREPGEQARPDGAKDSFYNALPQPYNAGLGPLDTLNELLLVRGWTAQTLYQPASSNASSARLPEDANGNVLPLADLLTVDSGAPNMQADGSPRINFGQGGLNINTLTQMGMTQPLADQIAARAPFKSFTDLFSMSGMTPTLMQTLLDTATFTGENRVAGKINLNTVSQSVLETLPNMTTSLASAIVSQQNSGFSRLSQLATVPGMTPTRLALLADDFSVGSDTWIVRAYGQSGKVGAAVQAVVRMVHGQPQILTWERLNMTGLPSWWDWQAQTRSVSDAGDSQ